jgi:hypothetical protein
MKQSISKFVNSKEFAVVTTHPGKENQVQILLIQMSPVRAKVSDISQPYLVKCTALFVRSSLPLRPSCVTISPSGIDRFFVSNTVPTPIINWIG